MSWGGVTQGSAPLHPGLSPSAALRRGRARDASSKAQPRCGWINIHRNSQGCPRSSDQPWATSLNALGVANTASRLRPSNLASSPLKAGCPHPALCTTRHVRARSLHPAIPNLNAGCASPGAVYDPPREGTRPTPGHSQSEGRVPPPGAAHDPPREGTWPSPGHSQSEGRVPPPGATHVLQT